MTNTEKRYTGQMLFWAILYLVTTYVAVALLKRELTDSMVLRTLIALLPMLPIIGVGRLLTLSIRCLDEMQRKIQLEAVVFSAVVTGLLTGAYGFLEKAGYPRLETYWVLPMLSVLWVIGMMLARRRYQ